MAFTRTSKRLFEDDRKKRRRRSLAASKGGETAFMQQLTALPAGLQPSPELRERSTALEQAGIPLSPEELTKEARATAAADRAISKEEAASLKKKMAAKTVKAAPQPSTVTGSKETGTTTGSKLEAASKFAGDSPLGDIMGGAAAGSAIAPGVGTIAGAGLGLLKSISKQKRKKRELKAGAISKQGEIAERKADKEQKAFRDMMDSFRSALTIPGF